MSALFFAGVAVTAVFLGALLVADRAGSRAGRMIAKPLASLGFLLAALGAGALLSTYGQAVFAALVLCLVGDVLLLWESPARFLGGLASFLLGHIGFGAAFLLAGVEITAAGVAFGALALPGAAVWRWLGPHVEKAMKGPVLAYLLVITAMVALAAGAVRAGAGWVVIAGAALFYLSDLSVARDKFVHPGFSNRLWGWPLYYGAQLLLAASVSRMASSSLF